MRRPARLSEVLHIKMSGTNWRVCIVLPGFRCSALREGHVFFPHCFPLEQRNSKASKVTGAFVLQLPVSHGVVVILVVPVLYPPPFPPLR